MRLLEFDFAGAFSARELVAADLRVGFGALAGLGLLLVDRDFALLSATLVDFFLVLAITRLYAVSRYEDYLQRS